MPDPYGPKRDRWGRYLLPDPRTGEERAWTRATTLASAIADTHALTKWQQRMVVKGLAMRQDLLALAAAASIDDRATLDRVAEDAKEIAGSSAGANAGTALHRFAEAVDRGEDTRIPPPWDADIAAYRRTLDEHGITTHPQWVERITIVPDYHVAGTLDRIVTLPDGRQVIGDVKTGRDLSYSWPEIAIQLALYAHATHMWSGTWESMPEVDRTKAMVFHVPAGQGRCQLYTVDIAAGWEMAAVAHQVRQWRTRKDIAQPVPPSPQERRRQAIERLERQISTGAVLRRRINTAGSVDELVQIWADADAAGTWTPELTELAAARKRALTSVSASSPNQ